MSKGNTFENDWMLLIFNATAIANMADDAASSPLTNLYVALHTADPGETGTQATSEATYGGYARVAVLRSGSGWTVTNNAATNAATISFPACSSGTNTVTYASVGVASSGSTKLLYSGVIGTPSGGLAVSTGITPQFTAGQITFTED
jgi:hypothetical protein